MTHGSILIVAAVTTAANPTDRTALLSIEQDFFNALKAADHRRLGELLHEDFVLVDVGSGSVVTRADLLGLMESGELVFGAVQSFPAEAAVRRVGPIGIVVGRTAMEFTDAERGAFTAGSRYTHVFSSDAGSWQLLSAQGTAIAGR